MTDKETWRYERHLPSTTDAFLTGIGGALDLLGTSRLWGTACLYRWQVSPPSEANAWALGSDFRQLGHDFDHALEAMSWEHKQRRGQRQPPARRDLRARRALAGR
jgi:hypothetical protein